MTVSESTSQAAESTTDGGKKAEKSANLLMEKHLFFL